MPELGVGGRVWLTTGLVIIPCCLDTVVEGPTLHIVRILRRRSIPSACLRTITRLITGLLRIARLRRISLLRLRSAIPSRLSLHVLHGHEVAALIRLAIGLPRRKRDLRMTELIVRGGIKRTMILEVLSRRFDAVMKSMTLHVIRILARRGIPLALSLLIAGSSRLRGSILRQSWMQRKDQRASKRRSSQSCEMHAFSMKYNSPQVYASLFAVASTTRWRPGFLIFSHWQKVRADSGESTLCLYAKCQERHEVPYSAAISSCSPSIRICSNSRSSASIAAVTSC